MHTTTVTPALATPALAVTTGWVYVQLLHFVAHSIRNVQRNAWCAFTARKTSAPSRVLGHVLHPRTGQRFAVRVVILPLPHLTEAIQLAEVLRCVALPRLPVTRVPQLGAVLRAVPPSPWVREWAP